jgi:hypothetical protein
MDTLAVIPATITKIINNDPGIEYNVNRIISEPPSFQVYVKPDGTFADKLYVNHTVTLRINTGTLEDVVVIPSSIIIGFGSDHVIKVVKDGKIINRLITIGYEDKQEGTVVVTSGLRPGESVLVN